MEHLAHAGLKQLLVQDHPWRITTLKLLCVNTYEKLLEHAVSGTVLITFFFKDFIYSFMRDTEREAETQAEGDAGSMQGAQRGTRSWDPRIMPWAEGRH